ncbi:MAG: outer membrane protein assembly factor BamA [Gemmatimonadetes bacterium]|nr:outer membrane protein assembly factor BamA [Gemmatimonadota bacterium]
MEVVGLFVSNSKFLFAAVLLISFSGAPHAQQEAPVISEIRVTGNEITETSLVKFSCGLTIGQRLIMPDDPARTIRNLYRLNFFSDVQVLIDPDVEEGVAIVIAVKEHPKLGQVKFEGNKAIKSGKLKKTLGLIPNQWISPQEVKRSETKIADLYREEGYLLAESISERGDADEEGRVPLTFKIKEGKKVKLRRIRFFGNETISGKKLRKQMKETKQVGGIFGRSRYNEDTFIEDKQNLLTFYQTNGFRDAEILSDSLYYDEAKENIFIDITIKEGPLYTFGKVTWEGNQKIKDGGIDKLIVISDGSVYSRERLNKSQEQISNLYSDIGYITASVDPRETPDADYVVAVHFNILENKPWKVRQVRIEGNTKTKDRVIRRELWIQPGQTFRRSGIERSMRNVQQLNFFGSVEPELRPVQESEELDLILKVEEKSTGTASVGAGFSEQDGLVGTIGLQIPNFLGNGQQLNFQWEFGTQRETFRVGFTEPWFLNTPTSVSGQLFRDTQRISSDFDQRRQGALASIGRRLPWPDFSRASVGYRIEQVKFLNFSDDVEDETRQDATFANNITSSVNFNYTRDSRDLPVFANSGSVISYTPNFAGGPFGGNTNFHKHDLVSSFYFPLFWKFALNLKTHLGFVAGYGGTVVPFNEKYTPGGISIFDGTMVRGYPEQSLGPVTGGVISGGSSQMLVNFQITVPIVKQQFYALAFADAGNSWENISETSMFDLRRSLGFGFRIMAPVVGIMGFDFAWGIDRRRVDNLKPQMMTHFQFGPQFF